MAKILLTKEQEEIIKSTLGVEDITEVNLSASKKKKTSFKGEFCMLFQDNIKSLSKLDLKPTAFKIFVYITSMITYGNIIINFSQAQIARDLGLQPSNVSRAFKELFDKGVLIKDSEHGHTFLNSNLVVKGIPHNFGEDQMKRFKQSRVENEYFEDQYNLFKSKPENELVTENKKSKEEFEEKEFEKFLEENSEDNIFEMKRAQG